MIFKKRVLKKKKVNIVCMGGGTGLFSLLTGLKEHTDKIRIKAIVTTLDNGGSSGKLITQYGVLPPGDIRNCLVALSDETKVMAELFQYRFDKHLKDHNFGNLLITALTKITGNFEDAIKEASKILNIKGEVIPVSLKPNTLIAELEDGKKLVGETLIDTTPNKKIEKIFLKEKPKTNKKARIALSEADIIIFGPGDLYTSIIPNILFPNMRRAIKENKKAKKILITPVMSKPGETDNFQVSNFIDEIQKYLKSDLTHVLSNDSFPASSAIREYQKENKHPILIDDKNISKINLVKRNLIDENKLLRHNPDKLSKSIINLI